MDTPQPRAAATDERLRFVCRCGAAFLDLGEFHDHALPCWQRRQDARDDAERARVQRDHERWLIGRRSEIGRDAVLKRWGLLPYRDDRNA
jgi:hypothetical protein